MKIPIHVQRLLDRADFQHVSSECHENWTYTRRERNQEIRWSESPAPEFLKDHEDLKEWIERKGPNGIHFKPPKSQKFEDAKLVGGFRILIQRTRIKRELDGRCKNATSAVEPQSHLTMQWKDPATFHRVAAALNFLPTYVSALYHASGHAESSTFIKPGQENECIGFLAQNTDYNWDPWSLALCYDPRTRIITGNFCAEQEKGINVDAIIDELKHETSPSTHPALLPVIMFERLLQSSFSHYARLHKSMCDLEDELKLAECKGCTTDEDLKHRDWSRRLNTLKKEQASRDGRHQFWRHFHREILNLLRKVSRESKKSLKYEHLELENRIRTIGGKFESLEGRDANSKRRIDAQLEFLYNIIQQNESRSQFHIAAAMSKDSSEVAFLTWLGALFLPAGVVGSFLGIQSISVKSNPEIALWFFSGTVILIAAVLSVTPLKMMRRRWIERSHTSVVAYPGDTQDCQSRFVRNILTSKTFSSRSFKRESELGGSTTV
ncbi:hypothetical protein BGZ57DRAFT_888392 [Hyaloscypha finlandica]|nr:hypothetical protein BGZ57DRAFT_888392 [Hyaloscypha finlandica]